MQTNKLKKLTSVIILSVTIIACLTACDDKDSNYVVVIDQDQQNKKQEEPALSKALPENVSQTVQKVQEVQEVQASRLGKISKDDEISIIWNNIGEPGQFPDQDGNPQGFQIDVGNAVMSQMNQKYKWVRDDNYDRLMQKLKVGEVHCSIPILITEERKKYLKFGNVQDTLNFYFWVHQDNNDIFGDTEQALLMSLSGKKVGTKNSSSGYEYLRKYKDIQFVFFSQNSEYWDALTKKEVDAVYYVDTIALHYKNFKGVPMKKVGVPIQQLPYGAGFPLDIDQTFIERWNQGLEAIKANGLYTSLKEKWFEDKK